MLIWLRYSSPYSCTRHFSCSQVNICGAKVSFFDDGFEKQYNEDSTRIEELRIYIELYHCMKTTSRCLDLSPRFLAVNSKKQACTYHVMAPDNLRVVLLFIDSVSLLDDRESETFKVINTHFLILRIMGKRSCMKIGSLAEYVLFYLIVHNLNGLFPVEKL